MQIGLYFGSFNPIHNGHLIIANKMLEAVGLDEVWFIPSPLNPFKKPTDLLDFNHRVELIQVAIEGQKHLKVNLIEQNLPIPSYTIQTIEALEADYSNIKFHIIMGSDILKDFHLWKRYDELIRKCSIHVYVRSSYVPDSTTDSNIHLYHLPLLDISSTSIRDSLRNQKSIIGEVDSKVRELIDKNQWYL